MSYRSEVLTAILIGQGMASESALRAVELIIAAEDAMAPPTIRIWAGFELDAHIYRLRGQGLTAEVISQRVGRHRCEVFKAIRRHTLHLRARLRVVA